MHNSNLITDIHAHVLPDLDDGPSDFAETEDLLTHFRHSGVSRVICTSHYRHPHFEVSQEILKQTFSHVNEMATAAPTLYPELSPGAEIRISSGFREDIKANTIPTLGKSSYILIEFPGNEISTNAIAMIYELCVRDLLPIMAHPERNIAIQKNPALLTQLIEAGMLLQLTASCFTRSAKESRTGDKLAWTILKNSHATVIASDAHNTTSRPPVLMEAYDNIAMRLGQDVTDKLIENANAIWDGEPCTPVAVAKPKNSIFKLFSLSK